MYQYMAKILFCNNHALIVYSKHIWPFLKLIWSPEKRKNKPAYLKNGVYITHLYPQRKAFTYTISIYQNILDVAFCIDVTSECPYLTYDFVLLTFDFYPCNIPHVHNQNTVNHLDITHINISMCRLIAKIVIWVCVVTPLPGGHIWAFLHQVLCQFQTYMVCAHVNQALFDEELKFWCLVQMGTERLQSKPLMYVVSMLRYISVKSQSFCTHLLDTEYI